jgi:hypothetical protein
MFALVHAIPQWTAMTGRPVIVIVIVIGGLAEVCRFVHPVPGGE